MPPELRGTLFRVGPGTKNNYGTSLTHLFDGDAHVTALKFDRGTVSGQSHFIETPERLIERQAEKMLYHEFGTACPTKPLGHKNSPNINVVNFGGRLLALSEATAPTELDPESLATIERWDFHGTLPKGTGMTAHPKIDPVTGDGYTFGITQAIGPELQVFRFTAKTGRLELICSIDMGGFYMVHDMMVTENHLVFLVPPVRVDLMGAATLQAPVADLLKFEADQPFRIFVVKKQGSQEPQEFISAPGGVGFHHVNAYEDNGKIIFDTILAEDMGIMGLVRAWSDETLPEAKPGKLTHFELDLKTTTVLERKVISDGVPLDFPCVDLNLVGQKQRFIYALEAELGTSDLLRTNGFVRWDLETLVPLRVKAEPSQMFGELVRTDSWLLNLGFESLKNETFLDVRNLDLEIVARVWLGRYLPLGFHGSFVS